MADSQRLMLSVWRKCKPVAWKGRRGAASSSRLPPCGAQTTAWRLEEPEAPAPWPCRDRRRPTGTTGGCPAGRRGQGQGAGAGRLAGAQEGPHAQGAQPGGAGCGWRSLLSYWGVGGIPKPAQLASLGATDKVQRLAGSRHSAR